MNATASKSITNRRRSYRTPCTLTAELHTSDARPLPSTRLKDISREGLCVLSWTPVSPGEPIFLRVPDLEPHLRVQARVTRCHHTLSGKFELGIEITPDSFIRYRDLYSWLWEVECFRQVASNNGGRPLSSDDALGEWRRRFSRAHGASNSEQ